MDAQAAPSLKDPGWVVAATGDLDGDRLDDILWQNQATGKTAVWFMKDDAVAGSREMATVADTNWTIAATGDFDGDGQTDILLHNPSTGGLRLWLMNGTSSVRQVSLGGVAKGWRVGGISLAGIGKVNIYFQEIATGRVVVWHMTGMHRDSSRAVSTPGDKNWVLVSVRQFAVDGIPDLVVHNEATGEVAVWLMRDSETVWTVRSIGIAADRNWKLEGVYF